MYLFNELTALSRVDACSTFPNSICCSSLQSFPHPVYINYEPQLDDSDMVDTQATNVTLPKGLRILCFGDSLTAGYTRVCSIAIVRIRTWNSDLYSLAWNGIHMQTTSALVSSIRCHHPTSASKSMATLETRWLMASISIVSSQSKSSSMTGSSLWGARMILVGARNPR